MEFTFRSCLPSFIDDLLPLLARLFLRQFLGYP